ncbi:transcriptional regulator [Desulfoluna limicola]|uniref:Transcriptional regulator n=1 Tax=Desulfoluna limicola TaxID=2810562 RepID=A0ABN6F5C7_9BACT|nr:Crp/Fnr family transcriptional regulator [Desulfoluna limicola]BCS97166.1 transcriptional regulator [Desulfoluna limicola]
MDLTNDLLPTIPLFRSLDTDSLARIADAVKPVSLKQGEALFRKGDDGNEMYIIEEGAVKIVLPSSVGEEIILTVLREQSFFGTMSMFDGQSRSADAVALTPCRLLVLQRDDFIHILQQDEQALRTILCDLSSMIRKTDDLLEGLCFFNISTRLAKRLLDLAEQAAGGTDKPVAIDLTFTQKELGEMVGATRESVNRELKKLREEGIIDMNRGTITISDWEALEELAVPMDF